MAIAAATASANQVKASSTALMTVKRILAMALPILLLAMPVPLKDILMKMRLGKNMLLLKVAGK